MTSFFLSRTTRRFYPALLSAWLLPAVAHGEAPSSLALEIDPSLTALDAQAFAEELREKLDLLGLEGGPNLGTLAVRADGDAITLTFVPNEGPSITRRIEPTDGRFDPETLAFAASHLVRDEASEILESLSNQPSGEAEATAEAKAALPAEEAEPVRSTEPEVAKEPPPPPAAIGCNGGRRIGFGFDFAPYVGTSSGAPDAVRNVSFNMIGGRARGLDGFELGIGFNYETDFACGLQIAAGANVVGGPVRGLQLAPIDIAGPVRGAQVGVVNVSKGDVDGAQVGAVNILGGTVRGAHVGVVAIAGGSASGAQIGGVAIVGGDVRGTQIGVSNIVGGSFEGSQIGVSNITAGDAKRLQMGTANIAGGKVSGVQLGAANVAGGEVEGAQIGVANFAGGRVSTTQIGVFNYAEEADAPIGILSIVRRGRTSIELSGSADGIASFGVRHGGRYLHNVVGVDLPLGVENSSWGYTFGLGGRIPMSERLHLDIDLLVTSLANGKGHPHADDSPTKYRILFDLGYALGEGFGIFGGPSVDLVRVEGGSLPKAPWGTSSLHEGTHRVHIAPGLTLGVRYDAQSIR